MNDYASNPGYEVTSTRGMELAARLPDDPFAAPFLIRAMGDQVVYVSGRGMKTVTLLPGDSGHFVVKQYHPLIAMLCLIFGVAIFRWKQDAMTKET